MKAKIQAGMCCRFDSLLAAPLRCPFRDFRHSFGCFYCLLRPHDDAVQAFQRGERTGAVNITALIPGLFQHAGLILTGTGVGGGAALRAFHGHLSSPPAVHSVFPGETGSLHPWPGYGWRRRHRALRCQGIALSH